MATTFVIPESEVVVTASRAGGPGGQHVNKASTRITLHWNIKNSQLLSDEQKELVFNKLASRITENGELVIHNSTSRSQQHNKKMAFIQLNQLVSKALHIAKKRMPTKITQAAQEARLKAKQRYSRIKKMRRKPIEDG